MENELLKNAKNVLWIQGQVKLNESLITKTFVFCYRRCHGMHVDVLHDIYFVCYRAGSVWFTVWTQHWTSGETAVDDVHGGRDSSIYTAVLHYL